MVTSNVCKKTLGRRRIEIKKIEKKTSLQVTFTKRRSGLFRKAGELAVLCDAEIAILIQSPAGKIFTFSHPSVEALIDRFETGDAPPPAAAGAGGSSSHWRQIVVWDDCRSEYEEAARRLEMEKRRMKEDESREFWWDEPYEDMELHELEGYLEALEGLRKNVWQKVEEKEKLMELQVGDLGSTTTPSNQELSTSSNLLALTDQDQPVDYDLFEFMLN